MNLSDVKNYEAAVSYCLEIPRFTKKNCMESTKAFYEYLGKPGSRSKIVHVAGTNGKGSVCAFLQSICMQMNKKVGMFTSPHLCDIRERVRINGDWITKEVFLTAFLQLAERSKARRNWRAMALFPLFMASWLPLQVLALFHKTTHWREIRHGDSKVDFA